MTIEQECRIASVDRPGDIGEPKGMRGIGACELSWMRRIYSIEKSTMTAMARCAIFSGEATVNADSRSQARQHLCGNCGRHAASLPMERAARQAGALLMNKSKRPIPPHATAARFPKCFSTVMARSGRSRILCWDLRKFRLHRKYRLPELPQRWRRHCWQPSMASGQERTARNAQESVSERVDRSTSTRCLIVE